MVFESLVPAQVAEKHPLEMIGLSFLYASIAVVLSLIVFPGYASFAMVTFTVIAFVPLMVEVIRYEHKKEESIVRKFPIKSHKRVAAFFTFLFAGLVLAYAFWFIILPAEFTSSLFFLQINTITNITGPSGGLILGETLGKILLNNFRVLGLCVLFSFFYGAGAIFILTWNASIAGVAIANSVKLAVSSAASAVGASGVALYFSAFSLGLLKYMTHGIPELLGYFLAGLAGGMISIAVLNYRTNPKKFGRTMWDAGNLLTAAAVLLLLAAALEVTISPLIPI